MTASLRRSVLGRGGLFSIVGFRPSGYVLPGRFTAPPSIPAIRLFGASAPASGNNKRSAPASAKKRSVTASTQRGNFDFPIKLPPNRSKQQRGGRIKGTPSYQEICFGHYGLRAMGSSWITATQLHRSLFILGKRSKHPGRRIWPRVFPSKSVSARPLATRMGKGKGFPRCLVAVVKPGRILFEIGGVSEKIARRALKTASALLPVRTQFVASETTCPS